MPLEMREGLGDADHAPLQRAERDPVAQRVFVDRAPARGLVRVEQLGDVAEAADELVDHAEPPRLHAQPSEILDRIAEVRELPVEHRA